LILNGTISIETENRSNFSEKAFSADYYVIPENFERLINEPKKPSRFSEKAFSADYYVVPENFELLITMKRKSLPGFPKRLFLLHCGS
jgi:hypothetical protein